MRYGFLGEMRFALDRSETLNEPTGTYSIFDTSTELPATVQDIGLSRHEVPLTQLLVMEAGGKLWAPPLLSSLSNCQTNNTDPTHQNGLQT